MIFDNSGRRIVLSTKYPKNIPFNQSIAFSVQMKDVDYIELVANGHSVARVDGEGKVSIPARKLGLGPVTIQARGYIKGSDAPAAMSEPLSIAVEPLWLSAQEKEPPATQKGLRITFDDGSVKTVDPSHDATWFANAYHKRACLRPRTRGSTRRRTICTTQAQTPMPVELEIDGQAQPVAITTAWQFVPLALKKGAHRLHLKADAAKSDPSLDLRFGASGTHSIEGTQFLCADGGK